MGTLHVRCPDLDAVCQLANELEKDAMLRREGYIDPTQERHVTKARRPVATTGESEGEGTRTPNHRIDSPVL